MRVFSTQVVVGTLAALFGAIPGAALELKDPYFGEALFHAYQGHYFEALERLDAEMAQYYAVDEPELDSLYHHIDHAEFSVGDFELHYRMHHRAGRAIKALLSRPLLHKTRWRRCFSVTVSKPPPCARSASSSGW